MKKFMLLIFINSIIIFMSNQGFCSDNWIKTFDGGQDTDSIIQTTDGNILVAGSEYDTTYYLYYPYVMKLDNNGSILWKKAYKGNIANWSTAGATSILKTSDGKYSSFR